MFITVPMFPLTKCSIASVTLHPLFGFCQQVNFCVDKTRSLGLWSCSKMKKLPKEVTTYLSKIGRKGGLKGGAKGGKKGGKAKTRAKAIAAKRNGAKGGRPREKKERVTAK